MDLSSGATGVRIVHVADPPPRSGGGGPREARWRGLRVYAPSASHALGTSPVARGRIGRAAIS